MKLSHAEVHFLAVLTHPQPGPALVLVSASTHLHQSLLQSCLPAAGFYIPLTIQSPPAHHDTISVRSCVNVILLLSLDNIIIMINTVLGNLSSPVARVEQ